VGTTAEILKRTEETLSTARHGLDDLIAGPPHRKLSGLRNLVVFGRAITNVLQNLRGTEPDFDEWYAQYRDEMESDPLMRYFYALRTKILKEGLLETMTHAYIGQLSWPEDMSRFGPPPPDARAFFIGDSAGGSGWEIEVSDGSTEKYYVELPAEVGSVSLHFPQPPKYHLGREIRETGIEALSRMYIDYLHELVQAAKEKFKSS
jgi:hypothetical protein